MEAPRLRPLGVGDIVDRVFSMYRQRPLLFVVLSAVPYLALSLVIGGLVVSFGPDLAPLAALLDLASTPDSLPTGPLTPPQNRAIATFVGLALVAILVAIPLLAVQVGALVDAAGARYLGRETTIGDSFRAGLRRAPKIVVAGLLLFLGLTLGWVTLFVLIAVVGNAIVATIAILGGLVVTVYVFASWLVSPVVASLEPVGPVQAVRRAWWLANGHRWRILGLQILLVVLQGVLSTLISFILVASFISDSGLRFALQNIVNVLATVLWAPVEWGTFTILYFDLRVRKEALDLQLAAEALPRPV